MVVKELIEKLLNFPMDKEVVISDLYIEPINGGMISTEGEAKYVFHDRREDTVRIASY